MTLNDFQKQAYTAGTNQALTDFGFTKQAIAMSPATQRLLATILGGGAGAVGGGLGTDSLGGVVSGGLAGALTGRAGAGALSKALAGLGGGAHALGATGLGGLALGAGVLGGKAVQSGVDSTRRVLGAINPYPELYSNPDEAGYYEPDAPAPRE
jgi:hypothetical protein